jgi:hypothetical protein
LNDYQKDLQFRKLNAQKDVIDVKVIRGGKTAVIKNSEIVVGDILMLDTGGPLLLLLVMLLLLLLLLLLTNPPRFSNCGCSSTCVC